jgi:hypothetical protein
LAWMYRYIFQTKVHAMESDLIRSRSYRPIRGFLRAYF